MTVRPLTLAGWLVITVLKSCCFSHFVILRGFRSRIAVVPLIGPSENLT